MATVDQSQLYAMLQEQQRQQQQLLAGILQQQQQQQQVPSPLQPAHQYIHHAHPGTLSRHSRTDSINPYLTAAAVAAAQQQQLQLQQQQQQQQYQLHQRQLSASQVAQTLNAFPSPSVGVTDQTEVLLNQAAAANGGSGSVVYENSYNSIQR